MIRKIVIPLLAVAGLAFAIHTVRSEGQPRPVAQPVAEPSQSPFEESVAGSGIIEPSSQNIAVGASLPGVVTAVLVKAGDSVKAGDELFRIDDRALRAELSVRQASLRQSMSALARLRALPRKEERQTAEARLAEGQARLSDMQRQLMIMRSVEDPRAVSRDELTRREGAVETAAANVKAMQADLDLVLAGAWAPEIAVAEAQVEAAKAAVDQVETELRRLVVRAPIDGQVLQVNVRAGEFAQAGPLTTPLMVMGQTDRLYVRVDVDENDAWRVTPGSKAVVALRGNSKIRTNVQFERIEPFVIPKRSLTGESTERVDTRVLQVLFSFKRGDINAYVGQLVDAHIEAPSRDGRAQAAAPAGAEKR